MMNYNYLESMKEDVKEYIINDSELSIDDLISGSYTFNSYKAKEYVLDNMDLLEKMCNEFCVDAETIGRKFLYGAWEWMDVSIRCYLLGQAISEVLDDIENEQEED